MADIEEIQRRVMVFEQKRAALNKFELSTQTMFVHLVEEVGEVGRQLSNKVMRPEKYDEANLKEEIVDTILVALILAKLSGVDLNREVDEKIGKLFSRYGFKEDE